MADREPPTTQSVPLFEMKVEPEEGYRFSPDDPTKRRYWRVSYRLYGHKRWTKFLVERGQETVTHLNEMCAKHVEFKAREVAS